MPQYRFVGTHADNLADGKPVAPGQTITVTQEDVDHPDNKRLIADGLLLELPKKPAKTKENL